MTTKRTNHADIKTQPTNIIDLILLDHRTLKDCIAVLKNENANPRSKYSKAKIFLETLRRHADAEEISFYNKIKNNEVFHMHVLEGLEEHSIASEKLKEIKTKMRSKTSLREEIIAKLKVLAEIVEHHVKEEESELLPKAKRYIKKETLEKYGKSYLRERKFNAKELTDYPSLADEMTTWKNTVIGLSKDFKERTEKYLQLLR